MGASMAVLMTQRRVERKNLHIGNAEEGKGRGGTLIVNSPLELQALKQKHNPVSGPINLRSKTPSGRPWFPGTNGGR
jgi:hypothetical protein